LTGYVPPAGNAANFNFVSTGYVSPIGNKADFDFGFSPPNPPQSIQKPYAFKALMYREGEFLHHTRRMFVPPTSRKRITLPVLFVNTQ